MTIQQAPRTESGPGRTAGTRPDLNRIIAEQEEIFVERQPESRRSMAEPGPPALAGGVTSSWQITRPQPVWLSHGRGSKIYDVDGNEYVDLHGGYGVVAGRARPPGDRGGDHAPRSPLGTHFAQPTRERDRGRPRSWPAGSACRCGGSPTPAPRPRWTPCT